MRPSHLSIFELDGRMTSVFRANQGMCLISEILAGADIDHPMLALRRFMKPWEAGKLLRSAPERYCMAD